MRSFITSNRVCVRGHEFLVTYEYVPMSRGIRDSLNGVPGAGPPLEPDYPETVEIVAIALIVNSGKGGVVYYVDEILSEEVMEDIHATLMRDRPWQSQEV